MNISQPATIARRTEYPLDHQKSIRELRDKGYIVDASDQIINVSTEHGHENDAVILAI